MSEGKVAYLGANFCSVLALPNVCSCLGLLLLSERTQLLLLIAVTTALGSDVLAYPKHQETYGSGQRKSIIHG